MEQKLGETQFPIEEIPDEAILFYRIHTEYIDREENDDKKKIKPSAFDPQPTVPYYFFKALNLPNKAVIARRHDEAICPILAEILLKLDRLLH